MPHFERFPVRQEEIYVRKKKRKRLLRMRAQNEIKTRSLKVSWFVVCKLLSESGERHRHIYVGILSPPHVRVPTLLHPPAGRFWQIASNRIIPDTRAILAEAPFSRIFYVTAKFVIDCPFVVLQIVINNNDLWRSKRVVLPTYFDFSFLLITYNVFFFRNTFLARMRSHKKNASHTINAEYDFLVPLENR